MARGRRKHFGGACDSRPYKQSLDSLLGQVDLVFAYLKKKTIIGSWSANSKYTA